MMSVFGAGSVTMRTNETLRCDSQSMRECAGGVPRVVEWWRPFVKMKLRDGKQTWLGYTSPL